MNVLSLFDGMSCARLALNKSGIEVGSFYSSEIDKFAIAETKVNFPDHTHLGDISNWRDWEIDWTTLDLITGGFPCFAAGTLVTTRAGLKPIEEIVKGDEVITHLHRFKKVVTPMVKISDHFNLVKIQGSHELKVTDEHPFYIRKKKIVHTRSPKKSIRTFLEPQWVDCKDLTTSHFVGVPRNQEEVVPEFSGDLNLWRVIGRYVADGHSSTTNLQSRGSKSKSVGRRTYKVVISCGKHKESQMDDFIAKIGYTVTKAEERTVIRYIISDKKLWEFIQHFGRGAGNKEIPSFLLDAPSDIIKAFIQGYISGDGCRIHSEKSRGNKNMIQFTTISEKLAYGIIQLIQKVYGTQPSISKHNAQSKKIIEGREVNQNPFFTVRFHKEKPKFAKYFVEDGFIWTPFKSKTRVLEQIPVYNFEVADDNSYAVNNLIVHNCQPWSTAGKQQGDKDPRGMLFWVLLDLLKHARSLNPDVDFLLENVKMKRDFEEYITSHLTEAVGSVHKILINSSLVSAQNRNRYYWTSWENTQPEDKGITWGDIRESNAPLCHYYSEGGLEWIRRHSERTGKVLSVWADDDKCQMLEASMFKNYSSQRFFGIEDVNGLRYISIRECCRAQNVPDDFFKVSSNTQAYRMLGNGWTVDVISHLFDNLKIERNI